MLFKGNKYTECSTTGMVWVCVAGQKYLINICPKRYRNRATRI